MAETVERPDDPAAAPSVPELLGWLGDAVRIADVKSTEQCIAELFRDNPSRLVHATRDERESGRQVHEAIDAGLRGVLMADDAPPHAWRRVLLPADGLRFARSQWFANAMWLRMSGSPRVDAAFESLDPAAYAGLPFERQAPRLGRALVVNDAARPLDYAGLVRVLDPRLVPVLTSWLLSTYLQSPDGVLTVDARDNQRRAVRAFEAVWSDDEPPLPITPRAFGACFRDAYADDRSQRRLAELVQGTLLRRLFDDERRRAGAGGPSLADLPRGGSWVVSSLWRESHVVHRCMGPMLEPLRARGAGALLIDDRPPGQRPPLPAAWEAVSRSMPLDPRRPTLEQYAEFANAVAASEPELVIFPEVGLTNDSTWLATQRLGRIQVTGYGHPVTSGSPHVDYFVGGTEVEGPSPDYTEQLVLVPGLGVSTTTPPLARRPRTRPLDDGAVRVVSLASLQKLHHELLGAWGAVMAEQPHARLDLLPSVSVEQARGLVPLLAPHLGRARVHLHPRSPREFVADLLQDADVYLDSFPFGGFNTLVEVLCAGCPVVTLEGSQARNRFGAAVLRRLGLPEWLIARDRRGYVEAARRLIADPGLRIELRARLGDRERVLALLADPDADRHFEAALRRMAELGPRAGRRAGAPLVVEAR